MSKVRLITVSLNGKSSTLYKKFTHLLGFSSQSLKISIKSHWATNLKLCMKLAGCSVAFFPNVKISLKMTGFRVTFHILSLQRRQFNVSKQVFSKMKPCV